MGQGVARQVWAQEEAEEEGHITTTLCGLVLGSNSSSSWFLKWEMGQVTSRAGWARGVQPVSTRLTLSAVRDGDHII